MPVSWRSDSFKQISTIMLWIHTFYTSVISSSYMSLISIRLRCPPPPTLRFDLVICAYSLSEEEGERGRHHLVRTLWGEGALPLLGSRLVALNTSLWVPRLTCAPPPPFPPPS